MIDFDAETHTYRLRGVPVPGVTAAMVPLTHGSFYGIAADVLAAASLLGRQVHACIEQDIRGELDDDAMLDAWRPYVAQWRKFRAVSGFEPILSESIVYSERDGYAGTLDLFGRLNGRLALVDAKRTAMVPRSAGPQTAAYLRALRSCRPDICPPGAHVDRFALHLKPGDEIGFRLVPFKDARDELDFLAALRVTKWRNAGCH